MSEIFHVYASQGPNNYVEMDLPASDYEMLDLMERLRLEPGQPPYVEVLKFRDGYDYLEKCIPELPDIYQLNALAKKQAEFTSVQDMAPFSISFPTSPSNDAMSCSDVNSASFFASALSW